MSVSYLAAFSVTKKRSDKSNKFSPEPFANKAVDVEVETGVENNEDMVEIIQAEPVGGHRVALSLITQRDPAKVSSSILFY